MGGALLWVLATSIVVLAAATLARRLDPGADSFAVVHTIVIAWAWVLASAALLSVGHLLTGPTLVLVVTVSALSVLLGCRLRPASRPGSLDITAGPIPQTAPWLKAAWSIQFSFWAGHVVSRGLLQFVTDWDSLMYHIPLVDYWLQARSLHAPASGHWFNPGGNELLGLWAVALLPNDCLVVLGNVPATLLLAFGVLEFGRLIGLTEVLRHLTALAVVSNHVVMKQLVDAENDVAAAGLFLVCLCYGLRATSRGSAANNVLGATALGLLCGVKYYALGYAAVAWSAASLLAVVRRGDRIGLRTAVIWSIGAVLVGGYWYARNLIFGGSPLYPLTKAVGGAALKMDYPHPWQTTFAGNGRPEVWPLFQEAIWRMTGPFQLAAVLAFPLVLAWLISTGVRSIRRYGTNAGGPERLALALAMVGSAAVLSVTPMALEDDPGSLNQLRLGYVPVRYGLGTLSIASLSLAAVLQDVFTLGSTASIQSALGINSDLRSRLVRWRLLPLQVATGSSALFQLCRVQNYSDFVVYWSSSLLIGLNFWIAAFLASRLWRSRSRFGEVAFVVSISVAATAVAMGFDGLSRAWDEQFVSFYGHWYNSRALSKLSSLEPATTRIAYYDYRCYPFFGARREFRLCQEKAIESFHDVEKFLIKFHVSHVITRADNFDKGWDNYAIVQKWVNEKSGKFKLIYSDGVYSIYEVSPPTVGVSKVGGIFVHRSDTGRLRSESIRPTGGPHVDEDLAARGAGRHRATRPRDP